MSASQVPEGPSTEESQLPADASTPESHAREGPSSTGHEGPSTDESQVPEGPSRARYNFFVREALEETQSGGDLYRAMIFGTLANAEATALIAMDTETLGGLDYRGLLEAFHSTTQPG